MDARLHFGSLRPKSKVPRALGPQRPDYVDCSLRKDYSPRDCGPLQGGMSTTLHQLGDTDENKEWQRLVGERVCISGVKQGILRYFGRTNFAQGYWCGVELDEPVGKNNGTVSGVVYFNCKPNHGIFAPVSKVSKLNDLSTCNWQQQDMSSQQHRHSGWDYNLGLLADSSEKKFIRNSISDPTFLQAAPARASMPRCSESFPYDKRSFTEQRDSATLNAVRNFGKTSSGSSSVNVIKNSSSSRSLSKYGYGKKNQYFSSNVITLGDHGGASETMHSTMRSGSGSTHNSSLTSALEEYEQFLRTPTNSGQGSPLSSEGAAKRFNELPFYDYGKMPDAFLGAFQSHDFSDFEDEVDNDDHMSVDYDESLGILTPSQMKDLTLGPDFPTSLSDIRGLDFPSSESFDDINDLPEDEQVHDVSVIHLSESSTTRNVEVSKQNNSGNYSKNSEDKGHVSSTGKFLFSIAQKDRENSPVDSRFTSTAVEEFRFNSAEGFERTYKINNLSSANVLCSDKSNNVKKDVSEKYYGTKTFSKEESLNLSLHQSSSALSSGSPLTREQNTTEVNQKTSSYHIQSDSSGSKEMICNEDVSRKSSDIDNSRDSFLQAESESNTTLKEKLTVSWEDCLSRNSDCMFPHVERPESVYTVGSNDTGFQEDGEMEGDAVMTTSIDSTDGNKRFSTTSRDSCIVSDEVDVYKIAESNSTSGYSTGLSDSCCNDRAEDDPSSKPLTDEEIQDSVGHCDSEDAFSFHENSLSKDADMMNMETSEVTTENVTALCNNDSASDALCETMVEDSTLTEIHDLLLSPEDNISPLETKEILVDSPKDGIKTIEESTNSPAQSTPEKKQNTKPKTSASRNTSSSGASRVSRTSRVCDDDQDRKKQVVKSPKKNVMSKIKAMIEATSCKTVGRSKPESSEPVNRRAVSAPKKSRWEAVTSKIAASLAEEKIKPKAKREIRSRVDTNLTLARQQICKSPKLDSCRLSNCGDGSMSPASVCSRDRRPLTEKNSAPSSVREGRVNASRDSKQRPRSPRHLHRLLSLMAGCAPVCRMTYAIATPPGPGKACSRSASPVAPSESSTNSISLNSKSKIAHWEGSTSTIASSVPPPAATVTKRPPPVAKAPSTIRTTPARTVTKKPTPTVPKIRISSSVRSQSPAPSSRTDRNHQLHPRKIKDGSLSRRPSEEGQQEDKDKECKRKDSPKLFRLFRRKKHRRSPDEGGPCPNYTPSEADEDDCASISSVATVASQPVTEVCHRDRTLSLFSSFRLSFPGGKKKSKRISATTMLQEKEPENNRYSSPDLRRDRLDGPCGQTELSKSSPSVKDTEQPRTVNSNSFNQPMESDLVSPLKHTGCNGLQENVNVAKEKINFGQLPTVKDTRIVQFETETINSFNPLKYGEFNPGPEDVAVAKEKLDYGQIEKPKSSPIIKEVVTGDFQSLEQLRAENSNSLNQLRQVGAKYVQQDVKLAKSVSFYERSLSTDDVTCVSREASQTVNEPIQEKTHPPEKNLSSDTQCGGKSTLDGSGGVVPAARIGDPVQVMRLVTSSIDQICDTSVQSTGVSDTRAQFMSYPRPKRCCIQNEGSNGNVCGDLSSIGIECIPPKPTCAYNGRTVCDNMRPEKICNEVKVPIKSPESLGAKDSANSIFSASHLASDFEIDKDPKYLQCPVSDEECARECVILNSVNKKNCETTAICVNEDDTLNKLHIQEYEKCNNVSKNSNVIQNVEVLKGCDYLKQTDLLTTDFPEEILQISSHATNEFSNNELSVKSNSEINCSLRYNFVLTALQNIQFPIYSFELHNANILNLISDNREVVNESGVPIGNILQISNNQNVNDFFGDYFVRLKLLDSYHRDGPYRYSPQNRMKSVLNFNSDEVRLNNLNNNILLDAESYLHKLTETEANLIFGNSFDSDEHAKGVSVWNVSYVPNIYQSLIHRHRSKHPCFDSKFDSNNAPPAEDFVRDINAAYATVREKNQIAEERCPSPPTTLRPPGPSVTVCNFDLHTEEHHIDTLQYSCNKGGRHTVRTQEEFKGDDAMLSNVDVWTCGDAAPNCDAYFPEQITRDYQREIYDDSDYPGVLEISAPKCVSYLTRDEKCSESKSKGCSALEQKRSESVIRSSERSCESGPKPSQNEFKSSDGCCVFGQTCPENDFLLPERYCAEDHNSPKEDYYVSKQKCSEGELESSKGYSVCVSGQENIYVGDRQSTPNGYLDCSSLEERSVLSFSDLTGEGMCCDLSSSTEINDTLLEGNISSGCISLENGCSSGLNDNSEQSLDRESFAQIENSSNAHAEEIRSSVFDNECSEISHEGVKERIKMFECISADVSLGGSITESDLISSNNLEPQKKNCEKNKHSMIPSFRKGIPTVKEKSSRFVKVNGQNKQNRLKDSSIETKLIASNKSQSFATNTPAHKSCFSSASNLNDKYVNSKLDYAGRKVSVSENNTVPNSKHYFTTCPKTGQFSTIPEISEKCKSEQCLFSIHRPGTGIELPVSNSSSQNRRHSSAALTLNFTSIGFTSDACSEIVAETIGCGNNNIDDSDSSLVFPSEGKSSNLTLDEISLSELNSSSALAAGLLQGQTECGLQSRCSSLPLVIGQVHATSPSINYSRRNHLIKDVPGGKSRIPRKQTGGRGTHLTTKPVRPPMWLSKAELTQEIQRLGNLCEARTKELNRLKMETKHVSVGFDAFAALFKYMAEDLNALSIPMLSEDLEKTLKQLELAKQDLAYYEKEVEEMKAHHCQELNDLSNKLFEVFQGEVTELSAKHQEEMNRLKHDHLKQIENLSSTYDTSSEEALAQHEILVSRLHQELITQRDELQMLHEKEILDLEQKHNQSTKTLQEHIEQLQKKCAELKHHSMGMEDAMRKDTDTKLQWVTLRKVDLEKEVESLKAVLEMKNKELHTLRVQNLEMEKQLEELPLARERIKMLQARAEDLEALMIEKTKLERKLSTENHQIKDTYEKESKVNKRLSMENEELQWRLRQAEHSLISGSFSEVLEYPEDVENGSISPLKSPAQMSRSVFFTFVDKEDNISTPRSQYKKITPGFSAGYKTSPAKSSRSPPVPSPRRAKSNSEPPQPPALSSTPRRSSKQTSLKQKRQRSGSDSGKPTGEQSNVGFLSFAGSMASSVSSECSVFEQRESLLEDHKEQILESLEILREQRSSEENGGEPTTPNNVEEKWNSDSSKFNNESVPFENGDMSRSSEFSDPKTYYHMTFPVLKEAGVPDCDTEDISKVAHPDGTVAQPIHSMAESSDGSKVDRATIVEVGSKATFISLQEEVALAQVVGVVGVQQRALVQSCGSTDNIQDSKCNGQSIEQDRWRTI